MTIKERYLQSFADEPSLTHEQRAAKIRAEANAARKPGEDVCHTTAGCSAWYATRIRKQDRRGYTLPKPTVQHVITAEEAKDAMNALGFETAAN